MTKSQWIVYYAAELMELIPGLPVAEAARLATRAIQDGSSDPELAAREALASS
jgi:hypothetical protein